MGKDFHAAFSNMNKAVRPGVGQPDVEKKKGKRCMEFRHICRMRSMNCLC